MEEPTLVVMAGAFVATVICVLLVYTLMQSRKSDTDEDESENKEG